MKKLFNLLLCSLLVLTGLTGCNSASNDTVGTTLYNDFKEYVTENPEANSLEIAEDIIKNEIIEFGPATMEIEEGYLAGFDNIEITGFKDGAMFAPMMSTIPFVGYVFTLEDGANVDEFVSALQQNANLRWNICTEAEELTVKNEGNIVFFLMSPKTFDAE